MNILDIAIAKKLAGGGGGSGTDNYNDLSNLPKINDTTLSGNKSSSALGLQSEINSDSKLASDLVDDTNQDNKFVTSTEKNTWNGKQNAIDADHKINADYVDDSTSTNKFVTASDKETWDAKQNAIDADHKLSSSLVSFTTAEAAALASGIDSNKVGQISTNQTNILLVQDATEALVDKGAKNLCYFADINTIKSLNTIDGSWSGSVFTMNGVEWTLGSYGEAIANRISANIKNSQLFIFNDYLEPGTYKFTTKSTNPNLYMGAIPEGSSSTAITDFDNNGILTVATRTKYSIYVRVFGGENVSNYSFKPMFCLLDEYKISDSYVAPVLPNYDLTRLEAEDRAALAEEIDAGAKSLVPMTWTNADPFADIHMTKNSDGSITVKATNTATTRIVSLSTNINNYLTVGKRYVLSGCDGGDYSNHYGFALSTSDYTGRVFEANGSEEFTYASEVVNFTLVVRAGESWTKTFKPMICTKAAFGVSKAFVPYRPNYDLVGSTTNALLATAYNTVTPANNYVTNIEGGYIRIGNLVVVNVKCTVNTNIPGSTPFIDGLPKPIINYNTGYGGTSVVNNKNYSLQVIGTGSIAYAASSESIPSATTLVMNCTYFTK